MPQPPIFVAREGELSRLNQYLDQTLTGQGQVCFITGNAGSGKSALVNAFIHKAILRHKKLVAAMGVADATTGVGDSYLPFREILLQLTGEVESKFTSGVISQENTSRLHQLLGLSGEAIAEIGPDLIGIFIPGGGLLARTAVFAADKAGWIEKLKKSSEKSSLNKKISAPEISQSHIFEQYSNVLYRIAKKHPLVLIVDDLHWADTATCELLFHLSRRIQGHPILIIGTYRPEEVAVGRQDERHPLEKVISELKRYLGDIFIELDKLADEETRTFMDAFIDSEPNRLGSAFRQSLFNLTEGHPLFTIELLRNMQESGDLVQDEEGYWITSPDLTWDELPTRVEGVIEERLNRLVEELRQALEIGSVEGETFTAEIIARIQNNEIRKLIRSLSGELEKKHHLVSPLGVQSLPNGRISTYHFQHNLFQRYLYHELDEAERAYLHEDVARIMEDLFAEDIDQVAVQLAHHYSLAGLADKALPYLCISGEQALARFAHHEALNYFTRALELVDETDAEMQYRLHLGSEQVFKMLGEREKQKRELEFLEELSNQPESAQKSSEVALLYAGYNESIGNYAEATKYIEQCLVSAKKINNVSFEARAYQMWGYIETRQGIYQDGLAHLEQAMGLAQAAHEVRTEACAKREMGVIKWRTGDYPESERYFRQALALFSQIENQVETASVLSSLGNLFFRQERFQEAESHYHQALEVNQTVGDKRGEMANLGNLGIMAAMGGNFQEAHASFMQILDISKAINDRESEARALGNLGSLMMDPGLYGEAEAYFDQALEAFRSMGSQAGCCWILADLGLARLHLGKLEQALDDCNSSLTIAQKVGNKHYENTAILHRAHIEFRLNKIEAAKSDYQNALQINAELGYFSDELDSLAGLAEIAQGEGKLEEALGYVESIIEKFDANQIRDPEARSTILLICYKVLNALNDTRCKSVLHQAYLLMMEHADKFRDDKKRNSFLKNVSVNQQIVDLVKDGALDPSNS